MCVDIRIGDRRRIGIGHVQRSNDDGQRPDEDRLADQYPLQPVQRFVLIVCQSSGDSWAPARISRSIGSFLLIIIVQLVIEFDEPLWIVGHPIPIIHRVQQRHRRPSSIRHYQL